LLTRFRKSLVVVEGGRCTEVVFVLMLLNITKFYFHFYNGQTYKADIAVNFDIWAGFEVVVVDRWLLSGGGVVLRFCNSKSGTKTTDLVFIEA
jgi:hypothetical protein